MTLDMTCFVSYIHFFFFFFQAEDGIRDYKVTGVQTCALPISLRRLDPTDRGVGGGSGKVPGAVGGIFAHQDLPAGGRTTRLHTEGEWETEAVGNPDGTRPGSADGDPVDPGAGL